MGFHSNQRRVIQHADRQTWRANERELVDVGIDWQIHLAIGPFQIRNKKLGLQIEELIVVPKSAGQHVGRLQVGEVSE